MNFAKIAGAALISSAAFGTAASALTFVGNGGIGAPNGDVTAPPGGTNYYYVSTSGGVDATANDIGLGIGSETNGSKLTSDAFSAEVGDVLTYYFNYVTSDGSSYIEYAYAQLVNTATLAPTLVFTARTNPNGDTVPGFGLPALAPGVVLDPPTSPVTPGATNWDKLGSNYSGACFAGLGNGCGSTGWIKSSFTVAEAGSYQAVFGVVNWADTAFDTGLAISGLAIDDKPILPPVNAIPLPASAWLLAAGIAGLAAMRKRRAA